MKKSPPKPYDDTKNAPSIKWLSSLHAYEIYKEERSSQGERAETAKEIINNTMIFFEECGKDFSSVKEAIRPFAVEDGVPVQDFSSVKEIIVYSLINGK